MIKSSSTLYSLVLILLIYVNNVQIYLSIFKLPQIIPGSSWNTDDTIMNVLDCRHRWEPVPS